MNLINNIKTNLHSLFHFLNLEISHYPPPKKINKRDDHFLKLLKKHNIDLILDVGAASGGYAGWLFELGYESRILAFEPLPEHYARLQYLSGLNPRLQLAKRCALGEEEKLVNINISNNLDSSSVLPMLEAHLSAAPHAEVVSHIIVPQRKLDSFANQIFDGNNSVFLKMDVQGYEKSVMKGAELILPRIKGIQAEMSLIPLYGGQVLFEELYFYIKSLGFELFYIRPGFADPSGRLLQFDGIFYRV